MNWANVKQLTIPNGKVKTISIGGVQVWKKSYTNLVRSSIDTNKSLYNGVGYLTGNRLNSSGVVKEYANGIVSGFIPYTFGGVIRAKGGKVQSGSGAYIATYDANFNVIKSTTWSSIVNSSHGSGELQSDGTYLLTFRTIAGFYTASYGDIGQGNTAYIRVSLEQCAAADFIVTVDEEIN